MSVSASLAFTVLYKIVFIPHVCFENNIALCLRPPRMLVDSCKLSVSTNLLQSIYGTVLSKYPVLLSNTTRDSLQASRMCHDRDNSNSYYMGLDDDLNSVTRNIFIYHGEVSLPFPVYLKIAVISKVMEIQTDQVRFFVHFNVVCWVALLKIRTINSG